MEDWKIVVLSSVCSMIATLVTTFITQYCIAKREKNKINYEFSYKTKIERYNDFYRLIDPIFKDRSVIARKDFKKSIEEIKGLLKTSSSMKMIKLIGAFYKLLEKIEYDKVEYSKIDENWIYVPYGEDGEELMPACGDPEKADFLYGKGLNEYLKEDYKKLNKILHKIIKRIRKESNLK